MVNRSYNKRKDKILQRTTNGSFLSKIFLEQVFCSITSLSSESYWSQDTHLDKGHTDVNSGEGHISDPRVYSVKNYDTYMLILNEALYG